MTSTARLFFDDLIGKGFDGIKALIGTPETEWLDFKSLGGRPTDPKPIWSEAISGFTNNQGGVLIWGVDARKDPQTNIDAACDLVPIEQVDGFHSRLRELTHTATEPPMPGIEFERIYEEGSSTNGYLVCFIPESRTKPHRAESKTNKPYMIRIADSFVVMPHALLRSLFFPSISPRLQASITPVWDILGDLGAATDVSFEIRIRNTGNATANDVLAIVYGGPDSWAFGGEFQSAQTEYGYGGTTSRPIHPKCKVLVGRFKARIPVYHSPNVKLQKQACQQMPFEATVELFARDMAATVQKARLSAEEIEARRAVDAKEVEGN